MSYSTASADAFARTAILRWKYGGDLVIGAALAEHLARSGALAGVCYDAVVPVPSHRLRLAQRGFNQAAVLARAIARARREPLCFALGRRAGGPSQTALGRSARADNAAGGFFLRRRRAVLGRRILLVDDVVTTTATVRACARAVLAGGASTVDVLALARAATPSRESASAPAPDRLRLGVGQRQ